MKARHIKYTTINGEPVEGTESIKVKGQWIEVPISSKEIKDYNEHKELRLKYIWKVRSEVIKVAERMTTEQLRNALLNIDKLFPTEPTS